MPDEWVLEAFPFDAGSGVRWNWLHTGDEDPNILWYHPCSEQPPTRWIDIRSGTMHRLVSGGPGDEEHVTVEASILCPSCGLHGYLREGRWVSA